MKVLVYLDDGTQFMENKGLDLPEAKVLCEYIAAHGYFHDMGERGVEYYPLHRITRVDIVPEE